MPSWDGNYILQRDPPNCSPASGANIGHCYRSTFVWDSLQYIHLQDLGYFFQDCGTTMLIFTTSNVYHCSSVKIHRLMLRAYGKRRFWTESITQSTYEWDNYTRHYRQEEGIRNTVLFKSWVCSGKLNSQSGTSLLLGICACHLESRRLIWSSWM